MRAYATVNDVIQRYKDLTYNEQRKAEAMMSDVSCALRVEAKKVGKDLDEMAKDEDYACVVKLVVCDIVIRALEQADSHASLLTQESQSAMGYSWSGSYVNTGGGTPILKKDLARLGLRRQSAGYVSMLGGTYDHGNHR